MVEILTIERSGGKRRWVGNSNEGGYVYRWRLVRRSPSMYPHTAVSPSLRVQILNEPVYKWLQPKSQLSYHYVPMYNREFHVTVYACFACPVPSRVRRRHNSHCKIQLRENCQNTRATCKSVDESTCLVLFLRPCLMRSAQIPTLSTHTPNRPHAPLLKYHL